MSLKKFFAKIFKIKDDSMTEDEYVDALPDGEPEPAWKEEEKEKE